MMCTGFIGAALAPCRSCRPTCQETSPAAASGPPPPQRWSFELPMAAALGRLLRQLGPDRGSLRRDVAF